jgi:hypothetical protein
VIFAAPPHACRDTRGAHAIAVRPYRAVLSFLRSAMAAEVENPTFDEDLPKAKSDLAESVGMRDTDACVLPEDYRSVKMLKGCFGAKWWGLFLGACLPLYLALTAATSTGGTSIGITGNFLLLVACCSEVALAVCYARAAPALEQLGIGTKAVAADYKRSVDRGGPLAAVLCFFWVLIALVSWLTAAKALAVPGTTSKLTGRLITPTYAAFMIVINVYCANIGTISVWHHTLKIASALAGDDVDEVILKVRTTDLGDEDRWHNDVVAPALKLATHTMPTLSRGFGAALGFVTLACWSAGFATFCWYLESRKAVNILITAVFAILPLLISLDVAACSSKCDVLRAELNDKRMKAVNARLPVDAISDLMSILMELNRGKGLGFVVFHQVIDFRALEQILANMIAIASTVVPVLIALIPPHEIIGACEVSELQSNMVWSLFHNSTCANLTIGEILQDR